MAIDSIDRTLTPASTLLTGASGGPDTVLGATSQRQFQDYNLLAKLNENIEKKVSKELEAVQSAHQQGINSVNREIEHWREFKTDLGDGLSKLKGVLSKVSAIERRIEQMIETVNKAALYSDTDTSYEGYSATFDSLLKGVERETKNVGDPPDMLGEVERELRYPTSPWGGWTTVNGGYVGNNYYITDSNGDRWQANQEDKQLRRYDSYPSEPSDDVYTFTSGLQVDSLSGDSITFTTNPNTGSPVSHSGTITREGLGMLNAWAYENLSTDTGRSNALADLEAAKEAVRIERRRYEAEIAMATFYEERANGQIEGLRDDRNDRMLEQARAIQEAKQKLQSEMQAAQSAVAQSFAAKAQASQLLAPLLGKTAKALINIIS